MANKVLFVSPAKTQMVDEQESPFESARMNISLPALTLLGSLNSQGFETSFIDLTAEGANQRTQMSRNKYRFGLPDDCVLDRIAEISPDALLVTSMFSVEQQMVDDLTARVKRSYPKLPIIVGGIHASSKPEWILESGNVDYVVRGEGENSLPNLIRQIQEGKKSKDRIINSERISDLNRSFALEEVLFNRDKLRYVDGASRRDAIYAHRVLPGWNRDFALYYARGCPSHCDYCTTSERDGTKIRHASAEKMFTDFTLLHEKHGIQIFYNQADTFGIHPEDIRFLRKVKEYRKVHKDFVLNNPNAFFLRLFFDESGGYTLNELLLDLLKDSSFNVITLAIETFNPKFSRKVDFSKIPPRKIVDLAQAIRDRDMKSEIYMMYGFPGQELDELKEDERIALRLGVDRVNYTACTILPRTTYYRDGLARGLFSETSYRRMLKEGHYFNSVTETFNFSRIPFRELKAFNLKYKQIGY